MGYPKQPGQDAEAHRRLAEEHLAVLQERDTLRADLATLKAENAKQAAEIERQNESLGFWGRATSRTMTARDEARRERDEVVTLLDIMVKMCDAAAPGAFDNGNRAEFGMIDEGEALSRGIVDRARNLVAKAHPAPSAESEAT